MNIESFFTEYVLDNSVPLSQVAKYSDNTIKFTCAIAQHERDKLRQAISIKFPDHKINFSYDIKPVLASAKRNARIKNVIVVGSGKGGVGKSSIAVNLAKALAKLEVKVGLLDLDLYGPNLPRMLGDHGPKTSSQKHDLTPKIQQGIALISLAQVIASDDPILWRGPMAGKVVEQLFWSAEWPELDYLLVDLPPGTGDILISAAQKLPISAAIIVTTPQSVACLDAQKAVSMFNELKVDIVGFINNMAFFACDHCGTKQDIFVGADTKDIAKILALPCLSELPLHSSLAKSNEYGADLPDFWQSTFSNLASEVALKLNEKQKDRSLIMPEVICKEQK